MSSSIIKTIVENLGSSKITERKRGITELRDFVSSNRSNLTILDDKQWSAIIKQHLLPCIETEIKAKSNKKTNTLKNDVALPTKQILLTLIEFSLSDDPEVDNADNARPYLIQAKTIKEIVQFILSNLNYDGESSNDDSDRRYTFGSAGCDILKGLLRIRKYSSKITSELFDELLQTFGDLLIACSSSQTDAAHYASCLQLLVQEYSREFNEDQIEKILALFEAYFKGKNNNFEKVQLHLIETLNNFCEKQALNKSVVLRKLANIICSSLLDIYLQTNSEHLKIEICKFLHTILNLRYYDEDIVFEKDNLMKIYSVLKDSLNQTRFFSFNIKNLSSLEIDIKRKNRDIYFEFCADCFYQVMLSQDTKEESDSPPQNPRDVEESPGSRKKRKMFSVKEEISSVVNNDLLLDKEELSNWIRLLYTAINRYFNHFCRIFESLTDRLFYIMKERKAIDDVHTHILKIFRYFMLKNDNISNVSWHNELLSLLIKFMKTECSYLLKEVFSLLAIILEKVDNKIAYETDFNLQVLNSKYFKNSDFVCTESLHLLSCLYHLHQTTKKLVLFNDKESIFKWIGKAFTLTDIADKDCKTISFVLSNLILTGLGDRYEHFKKAMYDIYLKDFKSTHSFYSFREMQKEFYSPVIATTTISTDSNENTNLFVESDNMERLLETFNLILKEDLKITSQESKETVCAKICKLIDIIHTFLGMIFENKFFTENRVFYKYYLDLQLTLIMNLKEAFKLSIGVPLWATLAEKLSQLPIKYSLSLSKGQEQVVYEWSNLSSEVLIPLVSEAIDRLNQHSVSILKHSSQHDDIVMLDDDDDESISVSLKKPEDKKFSRRIVSATLKILQHSTGDFSASLKESITKTLLDLFDKSSEVFPKFEICNLLFKTGDEQLVRTALEKIPREIGDNNSWSAVLRLLQSLDHQLDMHVDIVGEWDDLLTSLTSIYEKGFFSASSSLELSKCIVQAAVSGKLPSMNSMAELALKFLEGNNFMARLEIAKNCTVFMKYLEKEAIAKLLYKLIDSSAEVGLVRTALLALTSLSSKDYSLNTIFNIMNYYANESFIDRYFAKQSLTYLSKSHQFSTINQLFENNCRFFILEWLKSHKSLDNIPLDLIGYSTMPQLVQTNAKDIFPIVFAHSEGQGLLETLCSSMNMNLKDGISKNFCYIFAYCNAIYTVDATKGKWLIESKLREILGALMDTILRSSNFITDIVIELLLLMSDRPDNTLSFSSSVIKKGVETLAKSLSPKEILNLDKFLRTSKPRIHIILLNLYELITSKAQPIERRFYILKSFVDEFLGANIYSPFVFRTLINMLLSSTDVDFPLSVEKTCSLLQVILKLLIHNLSNNDAKQELYKSIPKIRNKMVNLITTSGCPTTSPNTILELLFESTSLADVLKTLEPFPDLPIFKPLNEKLANMQGQTSQVSVLMDNFIRSEHISVFSIRHISKAMRYHRQYILGVLSQNNQISKQADSLLTKLISKLYNICSGDYPVEWKEEAVVGLGELGLIQNIDRLKMYDKSIVDEIDINKDSSQRQTDIIIHSKKKIFSFICSYLTDPDINIVKVASTTINNILQTTEGKEICSRFIDAATRSCLEPFIDNSDPFILVPHVCPQKATPASVQYEPMSDNLYDTTNKTHDEWVRAVTKSLLSTGVTDPILVRCSELCGEKTAFAEFLFMLAVFDISLGGKAKEFSKSLSLLLKKHVFESVHAKKETIVLMMNTLDLLHRNYRFVSMNSKKKQKPNISKCFLCIDYLTIAKAASRAGLHFSALMFSEFSYEKDNVLTLIDKKSMEFEEKAEESQKLLLSLYNSIDDPDGIYGVTKSYGVESKTLLSSKEGDWSNTLGLYDATVLKGHSQSLIGAFDAMKNLGLDRISSIIMKGTSHDEIMQNPELREQYFENLCKTISLENLEKHPPSIHLDFNEAIYNLLYAIAKGDSAHFDLILQTYRKRLSQSINSTSNMQSTLAKLHCLSELEKVWDIKWTDRKSIVERIPKDHELSLVKGSSGIRNDSFFNVETVLNVRTSLFKILNLGQTLMEHQCAIVSLARKEGQDQLATNLVSQLTTTANKDLPLFIIQEAKNLYKKGDTTEAISILKFLALKVEELDKQRQTTVDKERALKLRALHTKAIYLLGRWAGETSTESYDNIVRFLSTAIERHDNKAKAYYHLGKYYDSAYQNIERKENSEDSKSYRELLKENKDLLAQYLRKRQEFRNEKEIPADFKSKLSYLQKIIDLDQKEQENISARKQMYRQGVLSNFVNATILSDNYDLVIIPRILNIWFSNSNEAIINTFIYQTTVGAQRNAAVVPPYKFVNLFYQIASRLAYYEDPQHTFNSAVQHLLYKIALSHPYHTLPLLIQIKNGDQKNQMMTKAAPIKPDPLKINSAMEIIKRLAKNINPIVDAYTTLMDAIIQLAFLELSPEQKRNQSQPHKLSSKLLISQIKPLSIPVLTADVPIISTGDYNMACLPCIQGFSENFSLAGGLNLPKIITCKASNGSNYRQLVKGNDDMRQDHVIEQLFGVVNQLLAKEKDTRKRKLLVRTYKVIPTSPTSGILGFVENTQPLATVLIGTSEDPTNCLHVKYRPDDISNNECRARMGALEKKRDTAENRIQEFKRICEQFKPVFHHFFLSQFPNPSDWFEKRQAYTKSVATISMVGYVIGLGDRHASNILIDQQSGEAVHIDLGICFEQGKYLPIPEIVPFRLTRDIIDGFGVCGVEGTFKNSCYATMNVLRNNMEALSLVVEVFLRDPLYKWALSPLEAMNYQTSKDKRIMPTQNTGEGNKNNRDAERALLRLREKLLGQEEGNMFGVKSQVNKLITEASALENLAVMFHGWAPFL
ncbi:hypothetical protein C9374_003308 [Naegleria lovaniensis]|uniref:non-specific serine/threonine protein kinase n=1 Tax=Naegleria lovaniensis TaxID=51637 RepID=A0AA88KK70_NAELO|nr:uncharacterized protein C9374_003308 [Naegleria lovaniensis]KAG2385493.1 hypothetical protein C9374_003308 [Naegleria lovaniensis]